MRQRVGPFVALVAALVFVGVPNAAATSISFVLTDGSHCTGTCAPGPFGTITVSTIDSATVDILVSLNADNKFVDTGGGHGALTFDILGDPAITIGALPAGFIVGPTNLPVPGMGSFHYSIDCPGCGPGASHANAGPLAFAVSASSGLTPEMFIANSDGYTFTADIITGNGNTGSVGSFGGTPTATADAPEPASLLLLGSGLLAACAHFRSRRTK